MKQIKGVAHVTDMDGTKFFDKVTNWIEEMQQKNLEVEVQYQVTGSMFNALILGRTE